MVSCILIFNHIINLFYSIAFSILLPLLYIDHIDRMTTSILAILCSPTLSGAALAAKGKDINRVMELDGGKCRDFFTVLNIGVCTRDCGYIYIYMYVCMYVCMYLSIYLSIYLNVSFCVVIYHYITSPPTSHSQDVQWRTCTERVCLFYARNLAA